MLEGIFEINSYEIEDLGTNITNTDSEMTNTNDEAK